MRKRGRNENNKRRSWQDRRRRSLSKDRITLPNVRKVVVFFVIFLFGPLVLLSKVVVAGSNLRVGCFCKTLSDTNSANRVRNTSSQTNRQIVN